MPKGVTLAHGGVIENGFNIGERMHLTPADRLWLAVPLFWSFGSANALPAILTHGGCAVLQESFEPGEALELLERERCTVYYGMANMARAMLEHPDRSPAAARRHAHRPHHRARRGHRDDDGGGGRARALQRLRLDGDLRELRGHRRPRSARRCACTPRACRCPAWTSAWRTRRRGGRCRRERWASSASRGHVTPGYFAGAGARRGRLRCGRLLPHRRSRPDRRRRARALPRPAEGDDQDRRHQRGAARGGGRAPPASGREAGLRGRRARP